MGLSWKIRRLGAMSAREIVWRVAQRRLQSSERRRFAAKIPAYEVRAYGAAPRADVSRIGLNFDNAACTFGGDIELLGPYRYEDYRTRWHAAFQTPGDWPVRFASDYEFGSEDVPGDIRTNWELNRCRQFALLAKSYFATCDGAYLEELEYLFTDWNRANPFMWGPAWASPMEESIRLVNWLVAAAFLEASGDGAALRDRLCAGAWAMAAHVREHYARYSSANNHTIVEAMGVAIASLVFARRDWLAEALALLEQETVRQTYPDGVNKEQALHYQLFVMEALSLVSHTLRADGKTLPDCLAEHLSSMAHYARACCVVQGSYIEFGDNDEGIILDLGLSKPCYPEYVLALATLELGMGCRWVEDIRSYETICWLYGRGELDAASTLPLAVNGSVESFPEGGVTIVRFDEGRAVLAFDHGPLGFGQLAAHGHADALSIQLFVDGEPVLIDPGTYIYNGNRRMRDLFRGTRVHNTVCIGGKGQSEALGPFLWGRKVAVSDFSLEACDNCVKMAAEHDGYAPVPVCRKVDICDSTVTVTDEVDGRGDAAVYLHLPVVEINVAGDVAELRLRSGAVVHIETGVPLKSMPFEYSPSYGVLAEGTELEVPVDGGAVTTISILRDTR